MNIFDSNPKVKSKKAIIERTIKAMNQLPEDKAEEISDFADFVAKRYEEHLLSKGMRKLMSTGEVFSFLNEDEEIYTVADLKILN